MTIARPVSRRQWLTGAAAVPFALGVGFSRRAKAAADAGTAKPPAIEVYGKLPQISNVALSPDGTRVAMVMTKDGSLVIYDYDLVSGKASAAAITGDKIRDLMWADNDRVVVVTSNTIRDVGDTFEESYGLIMDLPAGKKIQMYSYVSGVNKALVTGDFQRIKIDGTYYITAGGYKAPDGINMANSDGNAGTISLVYDRCLYAFLPSGSSSHKLDEDVRNIQDWVLTPDGVVLARSEFDDDTKLWSLRYKGAKGWNVVYSITQPLDQPYLVGMGRDGQSVLLLIKKDGKEQYVEVAPDGTFGTPLDINGADHWPIFSPTTFRLIGFGSTLGVTKYIFYDPAYQRLPALIDKAVAGLHADIEAFTENPLHVLVYAQGGGNPGTYYSIDFSSGSYKEIGESYPDLPSEWVADKTLTSYTAADGLEIPAYLTLPLDRDAKNLALVVLPHGGPEVFEDASFDWMSQALASRGYAVLQPNYRGSAGYGPDFTAKGYGEFGRKMQTDLSDGVRDLVKKGVADPKKVCIAGGSYGGYAALAGVSLDPGVYNCAVAVAGISDIKAFMDYELQNSGYKDDSSDMEYWKRFLGDESTWNQISPIKHVDAITVPVLLIHGKDDTVVPFEQSSELHDALQKSGKPVDFVQLTQEDHWLSREPTRIQTITAMVDFIVKNNPPV